MLGGLVPQYCALTLNHNMGTPKAFDNPHLAHFNAAQHGEYFEKRAL